MNQYIVHAAPYSSPNTRKNIRSNYKVQNLRVFQENPRAGGGVFAQFDLVNPSNPKDKTYHMSFSFADGTSMTANAINRIRRFFNEAYDRQRSSANGFPELSDTDKTQIVARINTAYNQFAGFSHSNEDGDIIDCTSDHLEHALRRSNVSYTRPYGFGGTPNYGTLTITRERGEADLYIVTLERKGARSQFYVKSSDSVDSIKQHLKDITSDKILAPDEANNTANLIKAVLREAVRKFSSQHDGYYSPNLQQSEPDYLSVKMSAIDDLDGNYLEHHGILGMKWGIRRYQNPDGSLTEAGRKHYGTKMTKAIRSGDRSTYNRVRNKITNESDRRSISEQSLNEAEEWLRNNRKPAWAEVRGVMSPSDVQRVKAGNAIYLERLNNRTPEEIEADNRRLDSIQEKAKKVTEEKITNNPEASGTDYLNYATEHGDKSNKGYDEWKKEYDANNAMTNVERRTFDFVENNIKNLSNDKKDEILRDISSNFDASYRDYPSVLVWDNKKNKIVAYPGYDEFSEDEKFKQYRDAWTSGNTIWLYTWGEQYDG